MRNGRGLLKSISGAIGETCDYLREVFKKPASQKNKTSLKDLVFLFRFVRPVWKLAALSLVMTALATAMNAILPLSSKIFIDFVILKGGYAQVESALSIVGLQGFAPQVTGALQSIVVVIAILIAIAVFSVAFELVHRYTTIRYEQELTFNVQKGLFDHVLRFPLSFFKNKQTGYLVARVTDDVNILQNLISGTLGSIASSLSFLMISSVILLALNAKIALIIIVSIPAYILINYFFSSRVRSVSSRLWETRAEVSRDIQEILSGVEVVKAHATEDREMDKVSGKIKASMQAAIKSMILFSASDYFMRGIQFLITLTVMWFGFIEIQAGRMTVGDYVAVTAYMLTLTRNANTLLYSYISIQPTLASLDRLMEMFKIIPEYSRDEKGKKLIALEKVQGNIRYENVSFAYEVNKPVLTDISLDVRPGETIALVGPSGSGKTTMVNLLLKFYTPQAGKIYIDGTDLASIDPVWLRKQVGIVSQDIFLFDDTIENNIKYGRPSATHEEVIAAAKMARIHEEIGRLVEGYNTKVGERGAKLSTGQRQRISIARAFVKNSPILIFDEPTSALDIETEQAIKESLRDLVRGKTTFIISHRMTMVDVADRTLVVSEGKIVQDGTHRELIRTEGQYTRPYTLSPVNKMYSE